jgi:hypothetical protein
MQKTKVPNKSSIGVSNLEGGSEASTPVSNKDIEDKVKSLANNLNSAK